MLISALSGHRGYTHYCMGNMLSLLSYAKSVDVLSTVFWKKKIHCDTQCCYGQTESWRGNHFSSGMCQVNTDAGSGVLGRVDSLILWVHLWMLQTVQMCRDTSAQSAAGIDGLGDEADYLPYLWRVSQQNTDGVWIKQKLFLGAMIRIPEETLRLSGSGCFFLFFFWLQSELFITFDVPVSSFDSSNVLPLTTI